MKSRTSKKKAVKGKRSEANKKEKEEKLIRLDDLLPKRNITGGRKSFFGSSNTGSGGTRGQKGGS